jgi:hypothetical protein
MRRLLLLGLPVLACGPSFQTIYENDARFEHCYAIDESGTASLAKKAACWNDWQRHHTFGQTRDRVEYAHSRYVALSQVPQLPTDEAMMQAAPGEVGESQQLTAPTPTNAFAPPQAMAAADAGTEHKAPPAITAFVAPPPPDAGAARPPGAACTDDCARAWDDCKGSHDAKRCNATYDRCVVRCVSKR